MKEMSVLEKVRNNFAILENIASIFDQVDDTNVVFTQLRILNKDRQVIIPNPSEKIYPYSGSVHLIQNLLTRDQCFSIANQIRETVISSIKDHLKEKGILRHTYEIIVEKNKQCPDFAPECLIKYEGIKIVSFRIGFSSYLVEYHKQQENAILDLKKFAVKLSEMETKFVNKELSEKGEKDLTALRTRVSNLEKKIALCESFKENEKWVVSTITEFLKTFEFGPSEDSLDY